MLGDISKKYESANRGVHTVSSGINDPGGVSYGSYQLSSKTGTMQKFLDSPEGLKFKHEFGSHKPGTKEFNAIYKKIAKERPTEFEAAQHKFIKWTHYDPVLKYAMNLGFYVSHSAMLEALWSQAVQHSLKGNKIILDNANRLIKDHGDLKHVLTILYGERARYVSHLDIADVLRDRYRRELADILRI